MAKISNQLWLASGSLAAIAAVPLYYTGKVLYGLAHEAMTLPKPIAGTHEPLLDTLPQGRKISVTAADGTELNVMEFGPHDLSLGTAKQTIILSHGWTCQIDYWRAQINELAQTHRVIAYDQRGHGETSLGETEISCELLGQDLSSILKVVVPKGEKAIICGHSMGGITIQSWAKQFPEQVVEVAAGIVLISTVAVNLPGTVRILPDELEIPEAASQLAVKVIAGMPAPMPGFLSQTFAHLVAMAKVVEQQPLAFASKIISQCPPVARARWGRAMMSVDVVDGLANFSVPAMVLVGTEDRITPVVSAEVIVQKLRSAGTQVDYRIFEGSGHLLNVERVTECNKAVTEFIGSLSVDSVEVAAK